MCILNTFSKCPISYFNLILTMNEFVRLYILVLPDIQKFENIFTIIVSKLNIKAVCLIFSLMEKILIHLQHTHENLCSMSYPLYKIIRWANSIYIKCRCGTDIWTKGIYWFSKDNLYAKKLDFLPLLNITAFLLFFIYKITKKNFKWESSGVSLIRATKS